MILNTLLSFVGVSQKVLHNNGVALLTINRPEVYNATNFKLHKELSIVWLDLARDDDVRVAVVTGAGTAFSAGGDFDLIQDSIGNGKVIAGTMEEARDIVHNMINTFHNCFNIS